MTVTLADSFSYCRTLARETGKNFYYSFLTLPQPLRLDMCVLYAFMRHTDDLGDDESLDMAQRKSNLASWCDKLKSALDGSSVDDSILPALSEMVARKQIPHQYLFDVIDGVEMDLEPRRFQTFADLENYCYHVAGAVGLCCIHIWGFTSPDAIAPAKACGTAFQLTNILRDLAEDIDRDRVYLPLEDLQRVGYSETDIRNRIQNDAFRKLMVFQVDRARQHYLQAEELFSHLEKPGKPILKAMIRIYGGLLDRIEAKNYDVYSSRISLSKSRKWQIVIRSMLRV